MCAQCVLVSHSDCRYVERAAEVSTLLVEIASVEAKIDGTYNVTPPRVLACRSSGEVEKGIGNKLADALR